MMAIPAPAGQAHALLAAAAVRLLGATEPSRHDVALALACLEGVSLLADLGEDPAPTEPLGSGEAIARAASLLAGDPRAEARALGLHLGRALTGGA